jgi:hypothetical protein
LQVDFNLVDRLHNLLVLFRHVGQLFGRIAHLGPAQRLVGPRTNGAQRAPVRGRGQSKAEYTKGVNLASFESRCDRGKANIY